MGDENQVAIEFDAISVEPEMFPYLAAAATRVGYLRPDLDIRISEQGFLVRSGRGVFEEVKRELLHAVYREKIRSESAELRSQLLGHLLSR